MHAKRRWRNQIPVRVLCLVSRAHVAAVLLSGMLVATGCTKQTTEAPLSGVGAQSVDVSTADRLQAELYAFADQFAAEIAGTAGNIAAQSADRRVRELSIRWKIQTIPTIQAAVFVQDPRQALFDVWVICAQLTDYCRNSPAGELFGEQQEAAIESTQRLESGIEEIARRYVPPDRFDQLRDQVNEYAASNPLRRGPSGVVIRAEEPTSPNRLRTLQSFLAIPISGVSESATAIDQLARQAREFTEVVDSLPQLVRWHAELFMLEVDSLETVNATRQNFQSFTESIQSIAETARQLPADLRTQFDEAFEQALDATDARQETLRATVSEAREAVRDLDAAIVRANDVVLAAEDTSTSLTEAARAWESTATVVQALVDSVQPDEEEEPSPDDRPFDIRDYTAAAERIEAAAAEMRALVEDVESGKLTGSFQELDATSKSSIDHAAGRMDQLLDRLTRIGLLLIVVLFCALVISRLLSERLARRSPDARA